MKFDKLTDSQWVDKAMSEYRKLGEQAFLDEYGFKRSRTYDVLDSKGRRYPPKAILAVAHKFIGPESKALPNEFSGGEETHRPLRKLGFRIERKTKVFDALLPPDIGDDQSFDPTGVEDTREVVMQAIKKRRGQQKFRASLLSAYQNQCAISGSGVQDVLEAAHIFPYRGVPANHVTNGIILRADLHTLFDLNLIVVDPKTLEIYVSPGLAGSEYEKYNGRILTVPSDSRKPSKKALAKRWEEVFGE